MANGDGFDPTQASGVDADPGGGAPGVGGPPPGGGGGDPSAGSPILAALAKQQQGPQVSAPGPGNQGDALNKLQMAIGLIQSALPGLPAGSPPHRDALNALRQLSKHMVQGQPAAGVQQTALMDLLRGTVRNAMMQKIMGQQGGGTGGPVGAGQMGPQPPMPSTPLPGA